VLDFQHQLVRAELLSEGGARAPATRFDVVLLDLGLPDAQGMMSTVVPARDRGCP